MSADVAGEKLMPLVGGQFLPTGMVVNEVRPAATTSSASPHEQLAVVNFKISPAPNAPYRESEVLADQPDIGFEPLRFPA